MKWGAGGGGECTLGKQGSQGGRKWKKVREKNLKKYSTMFFFGVCGGGEGGPTKMGQAHGLSDMGSEKFSLLCPSSTLPTLSRITLFKSVIYVLFILAK